MDLQSDTGTVVPKGEAAIVTAERMTKLELLVPDMGSDQIVPDLLLFITACMVRYHRDPGFVSEQVRWMEETRRLVS